jgi:radical SAM protein with 4Fe4S-binding SPASM domain
MSNEELKKRYYFVKEAMSLPTYQKIIEQLAQFPKRIKLLSLTGVGEPLLHKDIAIMVKIAKDSGMFEKVEFISNGSLLTPKLSDRLIANGLDTLRISIQGISSKKYKEICGTNINFDKLMNNIRYFYKNRDNSTKLFVKVLDIALEKNEEQYFYQHFSDCSDRMFIEKVQPTYDGVEFTDRLERSEDRYGRKIGKREICPLPFYMLGIFPNGDLQPCDNLYRPVILGNIHTKTIVDMWNSQTLRDFWKLQLQKKRSRHPKCSLCCAPDDVAHPEDVLDDAAELVLKKISSC